MSSLRKFYNEDAKKRICVLDALVYGAKMNQEQLQSMVSETATTQDVVQYITGIKDQYLNVVEKYITSMPTIEYLIQRAGETRTGTKIPELKGAFTFELSKIAQDPIKGIKYDPEQYEYDFKLGQNDPEDPENPQQDWRAVITAISGMKLSELSILNSTDYLRAIYNFDELVDPVALEEATSAGFDP